MALIKKRYLGQIPFADADGCSKERYEQGLRSGEMLEWMGIDDVKDGRGRGREKGRGEEDEWDCAGGLVTLVRLSGMHRSAAYGTDQVHSSQEKLVDIYDSWHLR